MGRSVRRKGQGTIHFLKTHPRPYTAVLEGRKRYELREDDRGFAVGDTLVLQEWDPELEEFTGRQLDVKVHYKSEGGTWGLPEDLCVLSISMADPGFPWGGKAPSGTRTSACEKIGRDHQGAHEAIEGWIRETLHVEIDAVDVYDQAQDWPHRQYLHVSHAELCALSLRARREAVDV